VWEPFGDSHLHYVPLGSLVSPDCDNMVAAGRCIDGDVAALSSVRVMGPCIAMGAAAANALDLAGSGSVHQIDTAALRTRLHDNLERNDSQTRSEASAEDKRHAEEKRQTERTHA
jgi:FAD dependent oxidoreductase